MVVAKLSWCQIVRCQIVLVPNCPVPNFPGAKLSVFELLVPNCPVPNCPTIHFQCPKQKSKTTSQYKYTPI